MYMHICMCLLAYVLGPRPYNNITPSFIRYGMGLTMQQQQQTETYAADHIYIILLLVLRSSRNRKHIALGRNQL